jgi:dihydrofolate reductase
MLHSTSVNILGCVDRMDGTYAGAVANGLTDRINNILPAAAVGLGKLTDRELRGLFAASRLSPATPAASPTRALRVPDFPRARRAHALPARVESWDVCAMQPLRYSINITLDGCCDHMAGVPDEETHRHAAETIAKADALILGRTIYGMMEGAWRPLAEAGVPRDGMPEWTMPFAQTIHAAKKYVVSSTLDKVDWNAEFLRGDLGTAVTRLKQQPGRGLYVAGLQLPLALAELGLIDEYEFIVHPRIAGRGPTLFAGLSKFVDLKLVGRREFRSGVFVVTYEPRK